jgi:hypothetical protein
MEGRGGEGEGEGGPGKFDWILVRMKGRCSGLHHPRTLRNN